MQAEFRYELVLTVPHDEIVPFRDLITLLKGNIDPVKGSDVAYKHTSLGYCGLRLTDEQRILITNLYEQIKPTEP